MKKFVLLFVIILFIVCSADAKIRRVGFFGSPISGTDYSTFDAANTAAVSGDTILIFPSIILNGTISKKLFILGPGNWLDPNATPKGNANQQAFGGIATIGNLTFDPGSNGSVLMGLNGGNVFVRDNNITIARNAEIIIYVSYNVSSITNLQILQNYRVYVYQATAGISSTNMNISNNLISRFYAVSGSTYSGSVSNNVWSYDQTQTTNNLNGGASTFSGTFNIELGGGAFLLQNNIFLSYTNASAPSSFNYFTFSNGGNSIFNNNLALESSTPINWGVGTGNVTTPIGNAANIFSAFPLIGTASADARYQLKAGSPALTAGAGGTAIGMFTSTSPYKLSTIPTIPSIYALSSPQGNNPTGSTIQINVSTKGNN